MTIRNLDNAVRPRSVAIVGASSRQGSVGRVVLENVVDGGFEGDIWPVNPKYRELSGRPCHARVGDLPGVPDLAVVVTPAATVPGLIGELGALGTRAAVVISAGLTRENGLRHMFPSRELVARIEREQEFFPRVARAAMTAGARRAVSMSVPARKAGKFNDGFEIPTAE